MEGRNGTPPHPVLFPTTSNGHERGQFSSIFDDLEARKSCTPGATFHIGFRSRGRRFPTKKTQNYQNLGNCSPDLPEPSRTLPVPGSPGPRAPGVQEKRNWMGGESRDPGSPGARGKETGWGGVRGARVIPLKKRTEKEFFLLSPPPSSFILGPGMFPGSSI